MDAEAPRRILVVEDEPTLVETIRYNLEAEGYEVETAADGNEAVRVYRSFRPALVLLDLMLPGMSGLDVCRLIRTESAVPIIMVTAKDTETDLVVGLELGADDYVTKPFSMRELLARIRAGLRRGALGDTTEDEDEILVGGPVELNVSRHEAMVRGRSTDFRPKEYELLATFLRSRGRLLTREFLIEEVWGQWYFGDTKTLDVHVKRIREKIEEEPRWPVHLTTVRGLGYKFVDG